MPLSGIESGYLDIRSNLLITITTGTPRNLRVCNTNRKINIYIYIYIYIYIPYLGKIFILYNGRAQFAVSANRLTFPVTLAVSYHKG
jgi:ABC-type arginine/histidine transport system permease subunit